MRKLLIKNGTLLSPDSGYRNVRKDIYIEDGMIAKIDDKIRIDEHITEVIDARGKIVTPGFIDIHTHCYPDSTIGLPPDVLGIERGSTSILDAGSSGADTYEDFRERYINTARTKVFTLLNVSKEGLIRGHELDAEEKIDVVALKRIVEKYGDSIVGLKARASASVVGKMGITPIKRAARLAKELGKPLMIHVGNYPPALKEVLQLVDKGDIITHAYHGKKGGIFEEEGTIIREALMARDRGVLFDVGHGVASFSLRVFEKALAKGFDCDLISTDLHKENYEGPVYNLASVVNKIIACGEGLEDAIAKCTSAPAAAYGLKNLGKIEIGYIADFNIFDYIGCKETVMDSVGDTITLQKKLVLNKTIYSRGNESEIFEHITGKHNN